MSREPLRFRVVSAPDTEPVSLQEAKVQLHLDEQDVDHDALVAGMLRSAVEQCEDYTRRALIARTIDLVMDEWPVEYASSSEDDWWSGVRQGPISSLTRTRKRVELPFPPLRSVTHVKTYANDDTSTEWASSNYYVDAVGEPGRLCLRQGSSWPVPGRDHNGIEIRFVAGYGEAASDVPEDLRQGILMTVAHLFEHRGDEPMDAAKKSGARDLWRSKRLVRVA